MAETGEAQLPATVAEAFAQTAKALEQFKIERVRIEGLSSSSSRGGDDGAVRTITEQEFMREFVFHSRPCVIIGALDEWPAMERWRDDRYLFDLDGHLPAVQNGDEGGVDAGSSGDGDNSDCSCTGAEAEKERDGKKRVTVALTPNGRADAVTYLTYRENEEEEVVAEELQQWKEGVERDEGGDSDGVVTAKLFMCAAEIRVSLPELYELLRANPLHPPIKPMYVDMRRKMPTIAYAQMQNNCLEVEYQHLHGDISTALDSFGARVFGGPHEAANVWFGTPASVSSMHQDWVENLYAVVRGVKEFLLVAPWEGVFVPKPELPSAAFAVQQEQESGDYVFNKAPVRDGTTVPWMDVEFTPAAIDDASLMTAELRERLHPLVVYVQPGEVLYLPAMWLHRVAQHADSIDSSERRVAGDEAVAPLPLIAAVNYWYDMSFTNPAVVMLREFGLLL